MLNPPTSLLPDQAGSAGEALAWTQQLVTKLGSLSTRRRPRFGMPAASPSTSLATRSARTAIA